MDVHPGLQTPTTLRRCSWCGEAEKPSKKLRKCAACEYAIYCSKECQKYAWPEHKEACQYMAQAAKQINPAFDAEVRPFGFAHSLAFSRALSDWLEAHAWALQTCTQAYVLQLGGINLVKNPPRFMGIFELKCHTTQGQPASSRNPAATFSIRRQSLVGIDAWSALHPSNAQYWEGTATEREVIGKYMQERCGSAFACLLCVQFKCTGVTMANTMNFPILHTRKRLPLDEGSMAVLEDVLELCYGTVNKGIPLRCPNDRDSKIPLPGRFVRKAGMWIWEPLFADWDEYSPTSKDYEELHSVLREKRKTNLSPKELFSALLTL